MSFAALAILDVLAVRSVAPGAVSDRRAAIAGALGYAISNVLGFGVVTGGALRYRIYSAEGLDAADVFRVTTTSYLAFWFGIATFVGLALVIDPVDLGMAALSACRRRSALGLVLLGLVGAALIWAGRSPRRLTFRDWSIPIPSPSDSSRSDCSGVVRHRGVGGRALRPPPRGSAAKPPLLSRRLCRRAGARRRISHSPGGLGVFEATIIAAVGPDPQRRHHRGARPLSHRLLRSSLRHRGCSVLRHSRSPDSGTS